MNRSVNGMPVVILAGGSGMYLDNSGERMAKGNFLVNGRPLLYYVIKSYVNHNFRKFIVSGGHQLEQSIMLFENLFGFKEVSDLKFIGYIGRTKIELQFVNSGIDSFTAERVKAVKSLVESDTFAIAYSDTISDINLSEAAEAHFVHNKIASLAATRLPTRFRVIGLRPGETLVRGFGKAFLPGHYVNGGYYFFNKQIWDSQYLGHSDNKILETSILEPLAENSQLVSYCHEGLWQHLGSERDVIKLEELSLKIESFTRD